MVHLANRFPRKIIRSVLVVAVLMMTIVHGTTVFAAANEGPIHVDTVGQRIRNNTTYGNPAPTGRYWDYVVSNDDYTDILETDVLVYTSDPTPAIQIIGKDLCTQNSPGMRAGDVTYTGGSSTTANYFRVYTNDGTTAVGTPMDIEYGYWNNSAAATCRATTVTLNGSGSPFNADIGMYIYRINAQYNPAGGKFANSFHVVAPAGSIVTQSSKFPFSDFGMQASYPVPNSPANYYTDIDIPFGPDCSLVTGTSTQRIDIIDADNGAPTQPGVQPRPFAVSVLRFTRSTGVYRGTAPLTPISIGAGFSVHEGGNVWRPQGANQTGVRYSFTASADEIYLFRIHRAYYNNTLQFRLPYDSAYYYRDCQRPTPTTIRAVTTMNPASVETGESLTATANAVHVSNTGGTGQVTYTRTIWNDVDRDGVRDPTERLFGGTPSSGTTSVPPGGHTFPSWSEIADTGIHGGYICIQLNLTAVPNTATTVQAPGFSRSCAEIGKKPKLQAANGDVVAGGTFPNGAGVCPTPSVTGMGLGVRGSTSTISGVTYSSFADFGVFSLGQITTFGTNGVNPQTPLSNYLSYGNIPSPLGFFMGTSNPSRCINNPFTIFGSRAAATNNSSTVDICNLGADTVLNGRDVSGKITLTCGSALTPGERRVVYVKNADQAVIENNITYANVAYNSIDQIPQMVVLSDHNIVVRQGVTQMDGVYAAKKEFQTCDVAPRLNTCTQRLTVNGAVIAGGRVVPLRTFGSQAPNYGEKAEVFRLRPDVLLNQLPAPGDETFIRTIDQREVPARF